MCGYVVTVFGGKSTMASMVSANHFKQVDILISKKPGTANSIP